MSLQSPPADRLLLLPVPQRLTIRNHNVTLPQHGSIVIESPDSQALLFSARQVQSALLEATTRQWPIVAGSSGVTGQFVLTLNLVAGSTQHEEGYSLFVSQERIDLVASTARGIHNGVQTLRQVARSCAQTWPAMNIEDWPDFRNRGVMLDISRNRVPTQAALLEMVELFASLKFNQLQLYTEHTFAYGNHPLVWSDASPMTGDEILALDAFCRQRFIELVPNQNTLGHMRPWLTIDSYRDLAEAPHGCHTRWGWFDEPFSLNPGDPRSIELVAGLLDELLPHFSSSQVNVGLDEPVDVGQGRSSQVVAECGLGAVFLEYLLKVHREVNRRGKTMQYWGDIVMEHPELTSQLPRNAIALEWGYEADHPFDDHAARFAAAGVPFYLCPGTSSWNSIGGRTENSLANMRSAARNGLQHGAVGYLVTDWGDNGHWQPPAVSILPFAYAAGLSWCYIQNVDVPLAETADCLLWEAPRSGLSAATLELGRVDEVMQTHIHNMTALFQILQGGPTEVEELIASIGPDEARSRLLTAKDHLDDLAVRISSVALPLQKSWVSAELKWAAALMRHACSRGLWIVDGRTSGDETNGLRQDADALIEEFGAIWCLRSRPGGYAKSAARLNAMRETYNQS